MTNAGPRTIDIVGSCPLDCPDGCSWIVTTADGVATRLRGNPEHPFTAGGLCKKVNPWLRMADEPTRLTQPLRRVTAKGSTPSTGDPVADAVRRLSAFKPIGWDEALTEIADRFRRIIASDGPAAIWPFAGTGNVGFLQGGAGPAGARLWNHLGVSGHHITICSISGHIGLGYTIGTGAGMDPEDVVDAASVVIWGSNTLVANQHWWPFVEQARANGAPVVVIDPVRTRTARRADMHVAPRPGTDGALALGLCRELIDRDAVDIEFVTTQCRGYDEFAAHAEPWTVARTAEECGLEPRAVEGLVELLAADEHRPLALKLGQGMQRHANGGQAARVISCLPAVLGAFDRPGGGLVYSTDGPYQLNVAKAAGRHLDQFSAGRPRHLAMTNLVANLLDVDDPPVKALFVYGANPLVSNPDIDGVRRGLSRTDLFTVMAEIFPTETIDYADIVLPSTMQHEHWDLNNSFAHLYLNLNRPAVEPPGACLPHTEVFRRLARAMGLGHPELYRCDEELLGDLLDTEEYREAGLGLDELKRRGWARVPSAPKPYRPFADGFPTPSGRFEFASDRAEADGHGRLPEYRSGAEAGAPAGEGGWYDLIANGSDWHINSVFAGTELTAARTSAPAVSIHPDDAARDALSHGDSVVVGNDRGSFTAVVAVDGGARPGVAATTKGWWSMGVNATVAERDSDMGRGAVYHDNRVRIERTPSAAT